MLSINLFIVAKLQVAPRVIDSLPYWNILNDGLVILTLQHLPLSPATNPCLPGQLVAGDTNLGRLVARDKLKGKARQGSFPGDFPERLGVAHIL
ncbi:hypothetical protein Tco_0749110 [Tanacetum coccineum]|uniref:Uncharacterized protein n=1 Tax=Tanacetum coccineum TaxID=301880 RepID=A0ABQ4YXI2_9ASTR